MRVCPVCRKGGFADRVALKAHVAAAHPDRYASIYGAKPGNKSAPAKSTRKSGPKPKNKRGGIRTTANSTNRRVSGSDLLHTLTIDATTPVSKELIDFVITPRSFVGSRLALEAELYTLWRPVSLSLKVTGAAGSAVGGTYLMGWSADSSLQRHSIASLMATQPHTISQFHGSSTLNIPCQTMRQWYSLETASAPEDCSHGAVSILLSAALNNVVGKVSLTVSLSYTIEFRNPTLAEGADPNLDTVYADPGWENYFSDSSSDWAEGKRLTLKEHEGGSIVTFSRALEGKIYELDHQAALSFYTMAGVVGYIKYGVPVKSTDPRIMAVFQTKEQAVKYAKSGSTNDCLEYKAAGQVCNIASPAWRQVAELQSAPLYTNRQPVASTSGLSVQSSEISALKAVVEAQAVEVAAMKRLLIGIRDSLPPPRTGEYNSGN